MKSYLMADTYGFSVFVMCNPLWAGWVIYSTCYLSMSPMCFKWLYVPPVLAPYITIIMCHVLDLEFHLAQALGPVNSNWNLLENEQPYNISLYWGFKNYSSKKACDDNIYMQQR